MQKIKLLLFGLAILWMHSLSAQEFSFTKYKERKGQPNTIFKSVGKDSLGYVWMGSDAGLIRFDGQNFKQYKENLPSNYIKYFLYTKNKRLLASTDAGVIEIHAQADTARFETLVQGGQQSDSEHVVYPKMLFEDSQERIWISCVESIARLAHGQLKHYAFPSKDKGKSYFNSFTLVENKPGNLFAFSQQGGLFRYDAGVDSFIEQPDFNIPSTIENALSLREGVMVSGGNQGLHLTYLNSGGEPLRQEHLPNYNVSYLLRYAKDKVMFGTWTRGVHMLHIDADSTYVERIENADVSKVYHLYSSEQGNVWVAGDDGVFLLRPAFFSSRIHNLPQEYVQVVDALPDGRIYTESRGQIFRSVLSASRPTFEMYGPNAHSGFILCFQQLNDVLIAGTTERNLLFFQNGELIKTIALHDSGKSISNLFTDRNNNVWVCQTGNAGVLKVTPTYEVIQYDKKNGVHSEFTGGLLATSGETYAYGGWNHFLYRFDAQQDKFINITDTTGLSLKSNFYIHDLKESTSGALYFATTQGVLVYDAGKFSWLDMGIYSKNEVKALAFDKQNKLWIANEAGLVKLENKDVSLFQAHNGLLNSNIPFRALTIDNDDNVWVGTSQGLCLSLKNIKATDTPVPLIQTIRFDGSSDFNTQEIAADAYLDLSVACLAFPSDNILFQTRLEPAEATWQVATISNQIFIPKLQPGTYKLHIRAKQDGNYTWSGEKTIDFTVVPKWYMQWWVIILFVLTFFAVIILAVRVYVYRLEQQKKLLEEQVSERTIQLVQKQELLEEQKHELEQKNEKINSSIHYAKTIQGAILPIESRLGSLFEHFVIYRPKDIVSGDFYWFATEVSNSGVDYTFLSVIDCSGHGVPGAFMSMIGYSLLNEIVKVKRIHQPGEILSSLHKSVREALKQDVTDNKDGMDMALIRLAKQVDGSYHICYAGAKNKLYYKQQGDFELDALKGDRKSIGGAHSHTTNYAFTQQELKLNAGDMLYLLSDGYVDQHAPDRKRFGTARLSELLTKVCTLPLADQKQLLEKALDEYQLSEDQRDDITVMGIRL